MEYRSGRDIQCLFSPPPKPTGILYWALDSAVFTVAVQLLQPELAIHAVPSAVYLRSFLLADTRLINVCVSVQWMWTISKSPFIRSCKNPTISFLQTAAFQLK